VASIKWRKKHEKMLGRTGLKLWTTFVRGRGTSHGGEEKKALGIAKKKVY